jgi:hypothetical protein
LRRLWINGFAVFWEFFWGGTVTGKSFHYAAIKDQIDPAGYSIEYTPGTSIKAL